jgi:hypothetical protein
VPKEITEGFLVSKAGYACVMVVDRLSTIPDMRKLSRGNVYFLKSASSLLFESEFVCVIDLLEGELPNSK